MLGTFHSILMPISYLLFLFIILLNQRQKKTLNNMDSRHVISSPNDENVGCFMRVCNKITSFIKRVYENMIKFGVEAKKLGKDDPRRIYHSLKVGLAITVVSLFYYFQPIYDGFGVSAMWAVITVVVVFEYTVGATLGKGFNRMISTLVAGFLGVLAHYVADLSGNTGEPILLALFGFIVAAIFTFMRFFPKLKARYDYGLMIFILTFALVAVSGYRDDEVIKMAQQRLWTVMIGSMIAMLICVFISPVWTGTELHNLIASNIENLAIFFQGFGSEYLKTTEENTKQDVSNFRQKYKSALATKTTEETMANFAKWEPAHGMFKFRHPWKQYLKIGTLVRHCAFRVDALDNYLDNDMQQTQHVIQENIKETCKKLSYELGNVMKEVASSIKKMKKTPAVKSLLTETKLAAQDLKTLLQDKSLWEKFNLLEVLPLATVASILIDIVTCVENIVEEVHELGCMANFKSNENAIGPVKELFDVIGPHYVVTVDVDKEATDRSKVIPDHKGMISSVEAEIKISCQ